MRSALLLVYILCATIFVYAGSKKEIVIKLDLGDCVNCSLALNEVISIGKEENVAILFEEKYIEDDLLIKEKFGLHNTKARFIFNDSFYNNFNCLTLGSSLILLSKGEQIYCSNLLKYNRDSLVYYMYKDENSFTFNMPTANVIEPVKNKEDKEIMVPEKKCDLAFTKMYSNYRIFSDIEIMGIRDEFNVLDYHTTEGSISFVCDSAFELLLYKKYFGEKDWKTAYSFYKDVIKGGNERFAIKSVFLSSLGDVDSAIVILSRTPKLQLIDSTNVKVSYFYAYNFFRKDGKYIKSYFIEDAPLVILGYTLHEGQINIMGDNAIMSIMGKDLDNSTLLFSEFAFDHKKNTLEYKRLLPFMAADNYIEYNLGNNLRNIVINDSICAMVCGEVFYDFTDMKTYNIPIEQTEFESLDNLINFLIKDKEKSFYRIFDIQHHDKGKGLVKLMYQNNNNEVVLVIFNKTTQSIISKQVVIKSIRQHASSLAKFCNDTENTIHYVGKDKCLHHIKY